MALCHARAVTLSFLNERCGPLPGACPVRHQSWKGRWESGPILIFMLLIFMISYLHNIIYTIIYITYIYTCIHQDIYICLLNTYSTCQWLCHLFPHHHWSLGSSDTKECSHWRQKRFTSTVLWLPVSCHDAEGTNSWSTFQISFFKQIEVMNFSQKWKSLSRSIWKRKYICYLQATQIHEQESLSVKWWCASLSILHLSCPGDPGDSQISTGKKKPSFRNSSNKRSRSFWAAPGCARRWGNSWRHASHGFPGK